MEKKSELMIIEDFTAELKRLAAPEVLSYFNSCEVTEVVGFGPDRSLVNVFSIIVFEERLDVASYKPYFLNDCRIKISELKDWSFGIYRYSVTVDHLYSALTHFGQNNSWHLNEKPLCIGSLLPTRPFFIPPDATKECPLNRVLKNNFWNGSYIFELFDNSKSHLKYFFEKPPLLQQLSEEIQKFVPLRLASIADRLGNIIIQVPVKILMSEFGFLKDSGMKASLAWDQRTKPRPCRVTTTMEFDEAILGFGTENISNGNAEIATGDSSHINRCILWDEDNKLILAATAPVASLREINFCFNLIEAEPRIIVIPERDKCKNKNYNLGIFFDQLKKYFVLHIKRFLALFGIIQKESDRRLNDSPLKTYSIQVNSQQPDSRVGDANPFAYREWIQRRIYSNERKQLEKERFFVQYGGKNDEHHKALTDLRYLLDRHGQNGAWLWDPYLDYADIMETLFFCKYHGAELRAMKSFEKRTRREDDPQEFPAWKSKQEVKFAASGNNYYGLNLEFRARHGSIGWSFHDRFLIFPYARPEALAWSLGTSINSIGQRHHILQRVDNGQLIVDAFLDLWNKLEGNDFLVWRSQ